MLPIIGISMGDPSGIGPEILIKALSTPKIYRLCRPLIVGDGKVISFALNRLNISLKLNCVHNPSDGVYEHGTLDVLDFDFINLDKLCIGENNKESGRAAFLSVKALIDEAMAGRIDATVTAPISKEALKLAGYPYPGHTEIYAALTGSSAHTMLLAHENLRVVHVSTHVSLTEACQKVKKARVLEVISFAYNACLALGIDKPTVAVAGLNPHSGENGLFGFEEQNEITPAINEACEMGMNVLGPIPPDTVFSKAHAGIYDIVVAMYHDQGHIPLKLAGFTFDRNNPSASVVNGVNITLGLPIIRCSVDHGTAFDIAYQGKASCDSLISAVEYAVRLCDNLRKV